jgi:hypothetical protein
VKAPLADLSRRITWWLAAAAAIGVTAWHLPGSFRATDRTVSSVAGKSRLERELLPARAYDIATEPFVAAQKEIPPGATFAFATGPGIQVSSPLVLDKAPLFAAYWLLPRRMTSDPHRADWVVSYGADLKSLGLAYDHVVDVLPGAAVAEVKR